MFPFNSEGRLLSLRITGCLLVAGLINAWTGTTGRFDSVTIFCFSLWRGLVLGTLGHQGLGFVATGIFVAIMHT